MTKRMIIDMIKAIILKTKINNMLWPKIVLAMTYIKNLRPTRVLEEFISFIKM